MPYWDSLYTAGHTSEPSPFAVHIADQLPADASILDLGCGNGRDSCHFAATGHFTVGLDESAAAIESAERLRDMIAVPETTCTFEVADVTDPDVIERGLQQLPAHLPRVIYGRFLLHSLEPRQARSLMMGLGSKLEASDTVYLEFRTDEDSELPKVYNHPRHFVSLAHFHEMARDARLHVNLMACGRGLAPFRDEDPMVARVKVAYSPMVSIGQGLKAVAVTSSTA